MRLISWLCKVVKLAKRIKYWIRLTKKADKLKEQGKYQQAIIVAEQALELAQDLWGEKQKNVVASLNNLAFLYSERGRQAEAEQKYLQALKLLQEVLGNKHPDVATILNNLAELYFEQGRHAEAEQKYLQALELLQEVLGNKHPDVATILNNLADLYFEQGRYTEAEPLFLQALEITQEVLGDKHPNVADILKNLAELYFSQGRHAEAETLDLQALELLQEILGDKHPDVADSLNSLATLYYAQGRGVEAEPLLLQTLELRQEILGDKHPDVADSLNSLATLYYDQGRYVEAEPLLLQTLELRQEILGDKHPDVANSLNNLATLYYAQGRYAEAEPLDLQALELAQEVLGNKHPYVADSLNSLAGLYSAQGRYAKAEPLLLQALKLTQEVLGNKHPDVTTSLNNLADLYSAQGRYTEAELLSLQALEITQEVLGDKHPDVADSLNSLAEIYSAQGRYTEAEPKYLQALEITQEVLGNKHRDVATNLNNLAALYSDQGRYIEAEPKYLQALELRQDILGSNHPDVADSLNNLASLYSAQKRYVEAEKMLLQALNIRRKKLGEKHPDIANIFNNLAEIYSARGRYDEAEQKYLEALEIWRNNLGNKHPNVASGINNIAGIYYYRGRYDEAEKKYIQALEMRQKNLGDKHPDVATSMNNMADLYQAQGRHAEAEKKYLQSLEVSKEVLGDKHPNLVEFMYHFAVFLAFNNNHTEALEKMREAIEVEDRIMRREFASSSERQRLTHLKNIRVNFEGFISLIFNHFWDSPAEIGTAMDVVLRRKSLSASALAAQNQALYSDRYPHLTEKFRRWRSLNDQIIHLTYSLGEKPEQLEANKQRLAKLEAESDDLQRQLASQVPEIQLVEQLVDRSAVAKELPEGSTLVEFVRFDVFDVTAPYENRWQPARYVAFVLPAQQPDRVEVVDLGEAKRVDRLIGKFRSEASLGHANLGNSLAMWDSDPAEELTIIKYNREPGIELKKAIFDPIRAKLGNSKHLLLAPDGNLNLVPFGILPADDEGEGLLMEEYTISYLSVGRDILRSQFQPNRAAAKPIVMADPDFDLAEDQGSVSTEKRENPTQLPTVAQLSPDLLNTLADNPFERTPGTRLLGEKVAQMLEVKPYLEAEALETRLTTGPCPKILLIATHGVFIPNSSEEPPAPEPIGQNWGNNRLLATKAKDPMKRSGVALAGANTWISGKSLPPEAGKGIAFAFDVAGLDLWANELTVLSACSTAIGDITIGEGVFGLRRAFAVAGAKTLVMSLWDVPDTATALLMERFFANLQRGLGRAEALQEAQNYTKTITVKELQQFPLGLELLKTELFNGGEIDQKILAEQPDVTPLEHPRYWGAWVCQGETASFSW